jgi:probable O-glycosylation ligase (exosortase A-associated)
VARAFVMVAPLAYYLAFHSAHRYVRWGMLVVVACCGLALLGTNSRGGWVAGSAAGLYFLLRSKHRVRLAAGGLTLGLVLFLVVPDARWSNATERLDTVEQYEADSSAQQRFDVWRFAWSLALSRPVVGGGFEVFTLPLGRETVLAAHSNYFEALGEHGFPGFALYLGLVFASWFSCYRIEKLAKQHYELYWARDLAIMLKVGLTGYLVGGLFINFAHNPLFYSYIAIIGGTLLTVRREAVRLGLVPAPRRSSSRAQDARGARTLPAE